MPHPHLTSKPEYLQVLFLPPARESPALLRVPAIKSDPFKEPPFVVSHDNITWMGMTSPPSHRFLGLRHGVLGIRESTFLAVSPPVSWSSDNVRNDQCGSSREQGARILPAVQPGLRGGQSERELSACEAVALAGWRVPMAQKGVWFAIFVPSAWRK